MKEEDLMAQVSKEIQEINAKYSDTFLRWEMIKLTIRGLVVQTGSRKKKIQK